MRFAKEETEDQEREMLQAQFQNVSQQSIDINRQIDDVLSKISIIKDNIQQLTTATGSQIATRVRYSLINQFIDSC